MAAPNQTPSPTADREIVVTRVLDAPRELVFRAWSTPEHIAHWWGPKGFTTTTKQMAFEPGGVWLFTMHGPDGRDYPNRIVFTEVVEPERLVYVHDDGGENVEPIKFHTTVTFDSTPDDKTKITLRMVFPSAAEKNRVEEEYGAIQGALEHASRLAEYVAAQHPGKLEHLTIALPSEKEVILRRVFHAPRKLVFEAMSRPEHMRHWWGPRDYVLTACDMDFRVGGSWRCVQRTPDGQEHPFRGDYLEIVAPERVVQTFIYDVDGIRDFPATENISLVEEGDKTILTNRVVHLTQQARDGHLFSGMEWGAAQSMDRLEELLASLAEK